MNEDHKIKKMELWGGPHDGEIIEIHEDNLKIKPIISVKNGEGNVTEYIVDNKGKFVWLANPGDENVTRNWFVCDDDGNVISEEKDIKDAFRKLDDFNDDSEKWTYK
ncbi:MAG: hypothetical protein HY999_02590 [Nitrospinae bacterium]|nr:hypothetical protein [Nitrospinota bacterium]